MEVGAAVTDDPIETTCPICGGRALRRPLPDFDGWYDDCDTHDVFEVTGTMLTVMASRAPADRSRLLELARARSPSLPRIDSFLED